MFWVSCAPDTIWTWTHTACVSWLPLVDRLCVLTSSDLGLSRPDASWFRSPALTSCDLGLAYPDACTLSLDAWASCILPLHIPMLSRPHQACPDPTIQISPFLTSRDFFLNLRPIHAACRSDCNSIRHHLGFSDTLWTHSNAILILHLQTSGFLKALLMSFTLSR